MEIIYKEFLTNRQDGIGSSDIAAILGISPYATAVDVYMSKTLPVDDRKENPFTKAGKLQEQVIAQYFADETGAELIRYSNKVFKDKKEPIFLCSPDYIFKKDFEGVLECKNTIIDFSRELPKHHWLQVMWQLGILEQAYGELAWLTMGYKFDHKPIEFNPEIYKKMQEQAYLFWHHNVLKRIPPEPVNRDDIDLLYRRHAVGKVVVAVPSNYGIWQEAVKLDNEIKEKTVELKKLKNELALLILDGEALTDENGIILATNKTDKDSDVFDKDKFMAEQPELYSKYLKTKQGSRRFLLKKPKGE